MIIDTEKLELQITISLDDAFALLSGRSLSDKGWKHLAGYLGEWYGDYWRDHHNDEKQEEEKRKFSYVSSKCWKCGYYVNSLYGGVHEGKVFLCYFCRQNINPIARPLNWGVESLDGN